MIPSGFEVVHIKPLSVNQAWKGKRFKTPEYKKYERDVLLTLTMQGFKPSDVPEGPIEITLMFGFSNPRCDFDNPIKPFVDILQKHYKFDDCRIYKATILKEKVKKGFEFIAFTIGEYDEQG